MALADVTEFGFIAMYFGVDGCLDIVLNFNLRLNWADRLANILIVSEKREHLMGAFNSVLLFHS